MSKFKKVLKKVGAITGIGPGQSLDDALAGGLPALPTKTSKSVLAAGREAATKAKRRVGFFQNLRTKGGGRGDLGIPSTERKTLTSSKLG